MGWVKGSDRNFEASQTDLISTVSVSYTCEQLNG